MEYVRDSNWEGVIAVVETIGLSEWSDDVINVRCSKQVGEENKVPRHLGHS
jgi:hypothetical protein